MLVYGGDGGVSYDGSLYRGGAGTVYHLHRAHPNGSIDRHDGTSKTDKELLSVSNRGSKTWKRGRPDVSKSFICTVVKTVDNNGRNKCTGKVGYLIVARQESRWKVELAIFGLW